MKNLLILFTIIGLSALIGCNSSDSRNTHESPESIPEGKEIKMDDVDNQLKRDAEKADSVKKALGIE